jgi:hypothetical protein
MGRMFEAVHRSYLKQSNTEQENSTNRKEEEGEHHNKDN